MTYEDIGKMYGDEETFLKDFEISKEEHRLHRIKEIRNKGKKLPFLL